MIELGIHAFVWVGGWGRKECRIAAEGAASTGFTLLEIPLLDLDAIDVADARSVLERSGLRATCSLGLPFEDDLASDDPDVSARGLARLRRAVDLAAGLGSPWLCGVLYGALGKHERAVTARGRAHAVEGIAKLAEYAQSQDVRLGLEAVNRYESNVLNTAAQTLSFVEEVSAPNVFVHLDSYHMNIEEADVGDAVRACSERLGYVHVGESHRGALGSGGVDLTGLMDALKDVSYAGPVVFEGFSRSVLEGDLGSTLAVWRDMWSDSAALARQARKRLEEDLAARGLRGG